MRKAGFCIERFICAAGVWMTATGCDLSRDQGRDWEDVKSSGALVMLTRNSPISYFTGRDGDEQGFEYEVLRAFARHIGVGLRVNVVRGHNDGFAGLKGGTADVFADGFLGPLERGADVLEGPAFDQVGTHVLCRKEAGVRRLGDLSGKTIMLSKSSGLERVARDVRSQAANVKVFVSDDASGDQIIQMVWEGGPDCTIADSQSSAINRSFMPELVEVATLSEGRSRVMMFSPRHRKLTQVFGEWLALPATARLIKDLRQAYFARPRKFDPFDIKVFLNRMGSRLPKFIDYFRKAGEVNALPWQLLAAIGYQESHWDETAESPTGVQGIMMLTRRAAKDLGVVDRTSAEESIFGGAKFFARLLKRLPEFLPPQERYWFALAAYNLGYGHLQDGRRLAIELNLNANLWEDVRKALPLLTQDKHFRDTRYGYARGHEAVVYVQRVRTYYESLKKRYPR